MPDAPFQSQVDRCLSDLEAREPDLRGLRRVPIDLIADVVAQELRPRMAVPVVAWKDVAIQRALLAIAARNIAIRRAKLHVLEQSLEARV